MSLDDVVGCDAEGAWLTFVGYPALAQSSKCCASKQRRERVIFSAKCESDKEARACQKKLRGALCRRRNLDAAAERKMLVFINPMSGPGKALKIWKTQCKQVFDDANVKVAATVTKRKDHALEMVRDMPLDELASYEAIVIVSGDGLMFEVLQGIMARPDWAAAIRAVSFGIIHGGSGNGLANSICDESKDCELRPVDAAFVIVAGRPAPLDIAAVDVGT